MHADAEYLIRMNNERRNYTDSPKHIGFDFHLQIDGCLRDDPSVKDLLVVTDLGERRDAAIIIQTCLELE